MSARPWYKRFPADFIAGTLQLSLEEKGAYSMILDLIYDRGGPIPDDSQWIARVCGCSVRRWNQIKEKLISENKIYTAAGLISNRRADKQSKTEEKEHEKLSINGEKGAEKTNEKKADLFNNSDLAKKGPENSGRQSRGQRLEKDTNVSFSLAGAQIAEAFSMYNEMAERAGLPKAQRLNKAREGKLAARLRDAGGLEGWAVALDKTEKSDFCSGRKTDFKASLDFLLQESSFTKLMEGNYDNGPKGNAPGPGPASQRSTYDAGMEGFSRAADTHARTRAGGHVDGGQRPPAPGDLFAERKGAAGAGKD